MRVVLEVQDGPDRGRKAVLRARQALRVGRTERSDFVLAGDLQLSSRHFLVECDERACQIRDLESTNGTLLNGQPIGQARLRHGDEIFAGQTLLRVSIESIASDDAAFEAPLKTAVAASVLRMPIGCQVRGCASGLTLIESTQLEPPPLVVAHRLGKLAAGFVLIDPLRAQLEGDALAASAPLVAELPPETSPRLIPFGEAFSWLEPLWGRDALAIVFSHATPEAVAQGLQHALRFDPATRRPQTGSGLLALHWPSVGRILLEHCAAETLAALFGETVEGVLYEGVEPAGWQLFCRDALAQQIRGAGFEIPATG